MKINNILAAALLSAAVVCTDAAAQTQNQQQNQAQQSDRETPAANNSKENVPVARDKEVDAFVDAKYSIEELVDFDEELNKFQEAYHQVGMEAALSNIGPYTVFAPTDAAFLTIPATQLQQLMSPEYNKQLLAFVSSHIVEGHHNIESLKNGQKLKTIDGKTLTVKKVGTDVSIDGVRISAPDIKARNGVVHKMEGLIMPSVKK